MTHAGSTHQASDSTRSLAIWWCAGGTLIGLLSWCVFMFPEWSRNPDLSHGLVTPILFLLVLHESRSRGTIRYLQRTGAVDFAIVALLVCALTVLVIAGLVAAALSWSNPLAAFLIAVSICGILLAGLLVASQSSVRWVPFNWPAFTACLIWLLSAPIPPGTYSRLSLALQMGVTRAVITTLHVFGIPAQQAGNIIQLATTRVGVEDACSGIRSLVSCMVAALFISATLVNAIWARTALILLAIPLAIAMNFLRSLMLTLVAAQGHSIEGALHDYSGYAVLLVTASLLAGFALWANRFSGSRRRSDVSPDIGRVGSGLLSLYLAGLAAAITLAASFAVLTRPSPANTPPPDIARFLPESFPEWRVETTGDLYRFRSTLLTDHLVQRTYLRDTPSGPLQITVYLAYWLPGHAPVSLVSSHTPDACWPGAGWTADPEASTRLQVASRSDLASAQYRTFWRGNVVQNVWFWHLYARAPVEDIDPFSPVDMIRTVLKYGIRSDAEQVFIRISSNHPWTAFENEPLMREILNRLEILGL